VDNLATDSLEKNGQSSLLKILRANTFPTLKTQRLILREPQLKDAARYHEILSCTNISRYSDIPENPTKKRSERFVSWMSKLHNRGTGIAWLICPATDSNVVGAIRINRIEKKAQCGFIGYELHPDYWNQGYATEALGAIVNYAHVDLSLNRLEAWTSEGNGASDHVLLKNGFKFEGMQREKIWFHGKFQNIRLFGRLASDVN